MSEGQNQLKDTQSIGPHQAIPTADERERFTAELFDILWARYRERVSHVGDYERIVHAAGATFVNDHIALRTFACQQPFTGIASIARLFEACGYVPAGCYYFPDKHLSAVHYQHSNHEFPKVFISELQTWKLSAAAQKCIQQIVSSHRDNLDLATLAAIAQIGDSIPDNRVALLEQAVAQFHELPWDAPEKSSVQALNEESQYAAWVAVHGYNVNHFTSLVNSHGVESLNDIEKTVEAMRTDGIPMKAEIEGVAGSKLRQSATEAAVIDVTVRDGGQETTMPWTYAYMEFAERGNVIDPDTEQPQRFEGFLGPQATHLFEMTKRKD